MIHLDKITRRFGPLVLFRSLSWVVHPGNRLGLVGPNGIGKTTILRLMAGLDEPDGGTVHRPATLRVGYLPQEVETFHEGEVLDVVLQGVGEIKSMEIRLREMEAEISSLSSSSERLKRVTSAYGELRHRFEALGGDRVELRARTILQGLGVARSAFNAPMSKLSGGWQMRVVLARLLLASPDLLLMDEPTNHLDLESIDWLERFLEQFPGTFIVVSHDRYFLNRMVNKIVEMRRGSLTEYPGNYDDYLDGRQAREEALEKAAKKQAGEVARTERFIERFRYKASKAKQVQSRVKALSKLERVETADRVKKIKFGFPPAPRSGDIVVKAEAVSKSYGETAVYTDLDLLLRRGDRAALVGPNGSGKTTLLKMLAGVIHPESGDLTIGHNVHVGYYAQHQLDGLDPGNTVLQELERVADTGIRERLRGLLGRFLFSGDDVDKKIAVLSGGEKARVALAKMLIHPSNLLLMDEPTNHLDLASREVLEDALNQYQGTLIVISHDRYFINRVTDTIAEVGGGQVILHPGDYDLFMERRLQEAAEAGVRPESPDSGAPAGRRERERESRRIEAEERNRLYRKRKAVEERVAPVESEISVLEKRLEEIAFLQVDPEVYSNPDRAGEIGREKTEAEKRLEELYRRWEELAAETPDG